MINRLFLSLFYDNAIFILHYDKGIDFILFFIFILLNKKNIIYEITSWASGKVMKFGFIGKRWRHLWRNSIVSLN